MTVTLASAVARIERHGILLVFPIENRPEPRSLWSELHLFSKGVFRAMLASLNAAGDLRFGLSPRAAAILELLEDDSPQSTKELRLRADMQGRASEAAYTRALRELWMRMLVVGAGEVADGAFPSLAIGATRLLFEDLWLEASGPNPEDAALLARTFAGAPLFARELDKARKLVAR
jgi:hypothetical protein